MNKILPFFLLLWSLPVLAAHGLALHGKPALPPNFQNFDYVNPDAPKDGELKAAMPHGFDTLNPFSINGIAPAGIQLTHDSLMKSNANEPFSQYGLIAQDVIVSPNRRHITFTLNPKASFNDGSPITTQDVLFSFNTLREKGLPIYRTYYQDVENVKILDDRRIQFSLKNTQNQELPLILGQMPILSKTYWENKDFSKTTLDVPVSSGPYLIKNFQPNHSITYTRNPDYWAKDLNVNVGFYNFKEIKYDCYLDSTVMVEAFRSGLTDFHTENVAKRWHAEQSWPEIAQGKLITSEIPHHLPSGMQGFVFNLRNPLFQDIRVRQALTKVLDFDWINKNLFFNLYKRTTSYFDNSDLKAPPLPDKQELKLLTPYKNILPAGTLDKPFVLENLPPRQALTEALELLNQAGWSVKDNVLQKDGKPFRFTLLMDAPSVPVWERIALPFIAQLRRLGIQVEIQALDLLQYKQRLDNFDYDMIVFVWGNSLSPGNEQSDYWGTSAATTPGSSNLSGIQSPAIDAIIEKVKTAQTQQELTTAAHALDRILLHHYLVIPHWYSPNTRLLHVPALHAPEKIPLHGMDLMTWWKK
ncbi:MAG: ABC transporter substrate-binding protein [Alphaproteobacteria bacterium]|nr:ABC transporter substrate-binding protein [Alphaproteobacteria bacterium]